MDHSGASRADMPDWKESTAGTMIRAALWLVQVVGEGNTFTKGDLREAFPGVAQADRRVRNLRDFGWVIHTNTDDASLLAEDQRFLKAGVPVWDAKARRAAAPAKAPTAKEIQAVLERDDYMCTQCGIAGAETYLDDSNQSAVLSVTRRETVLPDGSTETLLVTECKRCRAGAAGQPARADNFATEFQALDEADQRRLRHWIERGRRGSTQLDRMWSTYRRLPAEARDAVKDIVQGAG